VLPPVSIVWPCSLSVDGSTLTLTFDPAWLAAPGRAFPVVVDPTASYLTVAAGCTIKAANPTSAYCNTTDLGVGASAGSAQRGMLYSPDFNNGTLLVDANVREVDLNMPVDTLTNSVTVNAYPTTRSFTANTTWNTFDGTNVSTSSGESQTSRHFAPQSCWVSCGVSAHQRGAIEQHEVLNWAYVEPAEGIEPTT
jgi:hypothetical protein